MDLTTYAGTMSAYNRWMNERMYEACAALPDEQRKRDVGAFFKSIHGTLNHLLLADRVWMGRFTGVPFKVRSLGQELHADYAELRAERARTDDAIAKWAASLRPADFDGELNYTSIDKPEPRRLPLGLAIVHFFNHQTHHRGQVTALMKQCGVDPGVTDLLFMPR
jgi:uncharacterized damage-inducible protein DinB